MKTLYQLHTYYLSMSVCIVHSNSIFLTLSFLWVLINPRRMREGYGTCFVVRSVCLSVCLSLLLQRSAIASTRQLRYEQAKHDHGLQCDSWILLKCFRS